jgi:hypothetical protein
MDIGQVVQRELLLSIVSHRRPGTGRGIGSRLECCVVWDTEITVRSWESKWRELWLRQMPRLRLGLEEPGLQLGLEGRGLRLGLEELESNATSHIWPWWCSQSIEASIASWNAWCVEIEVRTEIVG